MTDIYEDMLLLEGEGLVRGVAPLHDDCVVASPTDGWGRVARRWSELVGGQVWCGDHGLTWAYGSKCRWVQEESMLPAIRASRFVCEALGTSGGWSIGSCARSLLKLIAPTQRFVGSGNLLMQNIPYGYHDCIPGHYDDAMLVDCCQCYYMLWSRLKSVYLDVERSGRLLWRKMLRSEEDAYQRVTSAVVACKPLRNALVGCSLGAIEPRQYYHAGVAKLLKGQRGPFRPAAQLIYRTAYELCLDASYEVDSIYSATDSVTSIDGRYPTSWERYGLATRIQASGPAEICRPGIYMIGSKYTHWYRLGSRFTEALPRADRPARDVAATWLARSAA